MLPRSPLLAAIIALALALVATACGPSSADADGDADAGTVGDDESETDTDPPDNQGIVPPPVEQSGVVYVAHWHTAPDPDNRDKLIWYRVDGDAPRLGGTIDLNGPTQAMALDPVGDVLAIASDAAASVSLYRVHRPSSPSEEVAAPELLDTIDFQGLGIPVSVFFNSRLARLYVAVSPGAGTTHDLYAYDVASPDDVDSASWLRGISGFPYQIPSTIYHAVDSARNLLMLTGMTDDRLHLYDLDDTGLRPLTGEPIDLGALYPVPDGMNSQTAFQARNITLDPWRNRVYIARAQTVLSELMAFEYPADVPRNGARYGDFASMSDLAPIADPLDVSIKYDQRQNLLGAYDVAVDADTGNIFMSADAWNGAGATAIVNNFRADLSELGTGCDDYEGFGCFVRSYSNGMPGLYLRTDGAMCIDYARGIVAATSVSVPETDPGMVHFYRYGEDLSMTPWLPLDGGNLRASSLPVEVACH